MNKNQEVSTKGHQSSEFNAWLWDSMKTLRQRYDIQNSHDTIFFKEAIDLAQEAWNEAAKRESLAKNLAIRNDSMKLFEIRNGAYGNSCVRCYAWAKSEQDAIVLFYRENPQNSIEEIECLFDAEEVGEFITRLDDNGWFV